MNGIIKLFLFVFILFLMLPVTIEAKEYNGLGVYEWEPIYWDEAENDMHHELYSKGYYIDDGYDLIYEFDEEAQTEQSACWWQEEGEVKDTISLYFEDMCFVPWNADVMASCARLTVRIPNTVNGLTVSKFYKSGAFTAFDVDPQNKFMKSDGQAVFTKNGKTLLSYARYNKSTKYYIPEGTRIIGDSALSKCDYIKTLYIPESVKEIQQWSLAQMNSLESIVFDSFDIKIDKRAFAILYYEYEEPDTEFVCTKTVQPSVKGTQVSWKPLEGAAYYEIYQKLNSGEYKLLKTTKANACKFTTLKSGKNYTFAVKPIAIIPAANYNKEEDEGSYPESFTIEGTMSEDIVLTGE